MRILRTFLEIAVAGGYRLFVMVLTMCTEKLSVMEERISKTFAEIAVC